MTTKKTTKKTTTKKPTTKKTTKKKVAKKPTIKKATSTKATTKKVTKKTVTKKPSTKKATTKKTVTKKTTQKAAAKKSSTKKTTKKVAPKSLVEALQEETTTNTQPQPKADNSAATTKRRGPDLRAKKDQSETKRPIKDLRAPKADRARSGEHEQLESKQEPRSTKPPSSKRRSDQQDNRERRPKRQRADSQDHGASAKSMPSEAKSSIAGKTDPRWEEIFSGSAFTDLGLRGTILQSLANAGFKTPTKIQAELIPLVLSGKDVLGQSRTGSGKTAAFGIPVVNAAIRGLAFQTIILAPTRELAIQITDELATLGKHTPIKFATVYGGQKIETQAAKLASNPEIIVATPGRLMDMMERKFIHMKNVRYIVLDEVDRMLDIGFRDDIKHILSRIKSPNHQTVFVSATISPEIESLSRSFMRDGETERLETVGGSLTVSLVTQHYFAVNPWDKSRLLVHTIKNEQPELAVVFCRMKRTVDKIAGRLTDAGIEAEAIHGDLPQSKRTRIMKRLKEGKLHVLVASDLAARGIDVDGITHVINFDLPDDPEIYVHRIGRTARAGRGGVAFSFVTPEQGPLLTEIEKLTNVHIEEATPKGFKPGPVPQDIVEDRKREEERAENLKSKNRYTNSKPQVPAVEDASDASRFPGGVVPTKLPPRRIGGKLKTARAIEQEASKKLTNSDSSS